jgi:hypothetical protein
MASDKWDYRVDLPAGTPVMTLTDRRYWDTRWKVGQDLVATARKAILAAGVPAMKRVVVGVEYEPPDKRQRSADAATCSSKYLVDGLVDAGIITHEDSPRCVAWVKAWTGWVITPKGRLVLYISEVE